MHVTLVLCAVLLGGCGLFGDDDPPRKDPDAADATDGDADTAAAGEGVLSGAWPQASVGRPGGVRPSELAQGWRIADNAAPGTGTGFIAAPCAEPCDGTCGIAYELAEDRRVVELQVATGPEDEVFLNVVEGPDAQHIDDPRGHRSRLLRVVARDGELLGRDELQPDLAEAARRVGLDVPSGGEAAGQGEVAFLARDLLHVVHPDGSALVAVGHLFLHQGGAWAVRDVALGLDPLTGRVRFALHLPAEIFTINRPFEPTYQAFAARLLSDGRLLVLRDGFVETAGRVFMAALPRDGEVAEMAPLALEEEGFGFSVRHLDIDARDRLFAVGHELPRYPLCGDNDAPRPRLRLRVFAPPTSTGTDAKLLHDEGGLARSFEEVTALSVAPTTTGDRTHVIVAGRAWNDPACADLIFHYM